MGLLQNRAPRTRPELKADISDIPERGGKVLFKTMAFKVEEDLHSSMKVHCARSGKTIADVINELMRQHLKENGEI